ncbi:MAG: aldehyde ferredoxin oxidoreductase family protein [Candidatus Saliniplasma sp.]
MRLKGGWQNKILRVNLTDKEITIEKLDEEDAKKFIGARGLGTKILYDEIDPEIDALSEDNKLIFAAGPLTGTASISASRYEVVSKGPLTGAIAGSNSGGNWGPEMKYAGYDAIIIEGKADEPVYLVIEDDEVSIESAEEIWGMDTTETDNKLKEKHGNSFKSTSIGPAGENQVRFASVMNDRDRAAGRSGVGAVMGSKNLKSVLIRGTKGIKVVDVEGFRNTLDDSLQKIEENDVTSEGLPTLGTPVLVNVINGVGSFPTRNFQEGVFEGAEEISGETLKDDLLIRNKACNGCPIGCGRVSATPEGTIGEGPEYETIWAFGADCGIDDLEAIIEANNICNKEGLDTITMGTTIACAMELYEKGIMPEEDTELDLEFGNAEAMVEAVKKTANKEGIGKLLAKGSYRLAEHYGHPELSMSSKKQEYPAYDPRGIQGIGLNYATSNRGGCHVRGYTISSEILGLPEQTDRLSTEGKPGLVKTFQDLTAAVDSSGTCLFTTFALGAGDIADFMTTITGVEYTPDDIMEAGERIYNLERMFNYEAGVGPEEDKLAPRLMEEPIPEGPSEGEISHIDEMIKEYYSVRGWTEDGELTEEKKEELGLPS